jgi:hypothetical protein
MAKTTDDQYSEKEAARRFEATLKAALNTPPKLLKDIPKKRAKKPVPQSKKPLKNKG